MLLPVLQVTTLVSWVDGSCTTYVNVSTLLYSAPSRGTEYCVKHVWRGTVVERRSLAGELSLSCARPAADG